MLDLVALTEELRDLLEREVFTSPVTVPVPKLKKPLLPGQGYSKDQSVQKTGAARPSNVSSGGDGTKAGVRPKELSKTFNKRDFQKTQSTPAVKPKAGSGSEKPSCPGGQQPRMVFGKWRCSGAASKGSKQAKSRIAQKRQKKKASAPKGTLAKLVHKARAALTSLFK